MKRFITHCILLLALVLLCAAGTAAAPALEKISYNNLNTAEQREELDQLLKGARVSAGRREALLREIVAFNASVPADALAAGWETSGAADTLYDPYALQEAYAASNPDFSGYNCRITALSLMADFVRAQGEETAPSGFLMMDMASLAEKPDAVPAGMDRLKFAALFAEVPTGKSRGLEEHLGSLKAAWASRGVAFQEGPLRLISVWFHEMIDEERPILFPGHAGVLIPAGDSLYFFEKVAFQEPYRLLRFASRQELSDYLMEKYDVSWDQPTAAPFIMENDRLMEGYRGNPLN